MREWTEQHIRELVRANAGTMSNTEMALSLRLWVTKINNTTIHFLNGGYVTFQVLRPELSELGTAYTVVAVEYHDMDYTDYTPHFFANESNILFSAKMTQYTLTDAPNFWTGILASLFYHAATNNNFWLKAPKRLFCDKVETKDASVLFSSCAVWTDAKHNSGISPNNVMGIVKFQGIPAGTKVVSAIYHI